MVTRARILWSMSCLRMEMQPIKVSGLTIIDRFETWRSLHLSSYLEVGQFLTENPVVFCIVCNQLCLPTIFIDLFPLQMIPCVFFSFNIREFPYPSCSFYSGHCPQREQQPMAYHAYYRKGLSRVNANQHEHQSKSLPTFVWDMPFVCPQ